VEIAHEMAVWPAEKWRRERLWKSRGVEKSKNDFPTPLGNPANPRGIPTFPQPRRLRDFNYKPDISLTKKRGHF
jgi:hypothetical protein